jgi:lysozyme
VQRGAQIATTGVLVTAATLFFWRDLEGFSLMPYQDQAGVWTVCAGHTGPDVIPGKAWTRAQCDIKDWQNLNHFGRVVVRCTDNAPLSRGQRDSLTVFAGNVGETAFCGSTLAKQMREGQYMVNDQFQRWVYISCRTAGGCQYNEGLFNRRVKEIGRFHVPGAPTVYDGSGT